MCAGHKIFNINFLPDVVAFTLEEMCLWALALTAAILHKKDMAELRKHLLLSIWPLATGRKQLHW
jgi:hypothetical protein